MKQYVTRNKVAALLGVSGTTAYVWARTKMLPPPDAVFNGRPAWRKETILAWHAGQKRRAEHPRRAGSLLAAIEPHVDAILQHERKRNPKAAPLIDAIARAVAAGGVTTRSLVSAAEELGSAMESVRQRLYKMAAHWALDELEARQKPNGSQA